MPVRPASLFAALLLLPFAAAAQQPPRALDVQWSTGEHNPTAALVPLDHDDDNDDGVPDLEERPAPDGAVDNEVTRIVVSGVGPAGLHVTTTGGLRVVGGAGLVTDVSIPASPGGRAQVSLVGVSASQQADDASVTFESGAARQRVRVSVVAVSLLQGDNEPVWAHRDAARLSHEITNNDTLPRVSAWADRSPDVDNLRAEVWDPAPGRAGVVRIAALGTRASVGVIPGGARGAINDLIVARPSDEIPFRSLFVRLVGDETDLHAPGTQGQTLLVGLRDRVYVRYRRIDAAGEATTDVHVGRPGNEDGPLAARRARWHLVVMRDRPGGHPMIGGDDVNATRIAREQVVVSNEVYLQCMITFGDPASYPVLLADPPQNTLLAVGDDDGLLARGGEVRFRAGGRSVGPVRVRAGARPIETADAIGQALRAMGLVPRVTLNRRTDYGADGSADVIVRDARDHILELSPVPGVALTTDPQQSVAIGRVDLADGLDEFNNLNSSSGTLEERTLLKTLADTDPGTIDVFVVNGFTHQTRIGEAFVEGDGSAILNALILDRAGIAAQREAWTQAHEAGHIFLNQPWHPDNMGPDRPWLLMDADASLGAVSGPKRLLREECDRITVESGVGATPSLLARYDEVQRSPRAASFASWPSATLYPRTAVVRGGVLGGSSPAQEAPRDATAADSGLVIW